VDASVFPEIFALSISILLFQPIVSRLGRHTNTWLTGWILLLVHYVARIVRPSQGLGGRICLLVALCAVQLAAVCFLRASGNIHKTRVSKRLTMLLMLPMLAQAVLAVVHPSYELPQRLVSLLCFAPAMQQLAARDRTRSLNWLAGAFALVGAVVVCLHQPEPGLVMQALLMLVCFGVAGTYMTFAPRMTRASIAAVCGLIGWGLTFPVAEGLHLFRPGLALNHNFLVIPQFVFAVGIVFSFVEEVVTKAEHQALHDPLTGLPNARLFEQRVASAMREANATGTPLAFLVIDVDKFKDINDTLGHAAGDELLRSLAVRLSWHIGSGDMLARTGGDEFTAILAGVADEHHLRFIARAMMSAASVPFIIGGAPIDCRISVGIAVAPRHGEDAGTLREAADQAMYRAKRKGGSLLAFAGEEEEIWAR
jgi:diguanylate cyclase (GGDEF)-like protein